MEEPKSYRRMNAAFLAAAFMVLVVILVLSNTKFGEAAILGIVVAAPLVLYLVASGDVTEIGGPGGFMAKFRADARAPVDTAADVEALEIVAKAALNQSNKMSPVGVRPGAPIALTLRLSDPTANYNANAIEQYILSLTKLDADVTVIFITTDGLFKASTDGAAVVAIVNNDHFSTELKNAIRTGDIAKLRTLVPISDKAVEKSESNASALKRMMDSNVRSLVAVDGTGRPVGVVRRDRIVAKLVSSLAGSA